MTLRPTLRRCLLCSGAGCRKCGFKGFRVEWRQWIANPGDNREAPA